jgi:hypothetical protein
MLPVLICSFMPPSSMVILEFFTWFVNLLIIFQSKSKNLEKKYFLDQKFAPKWNFKAKPIFVVSVY